MHSHITLAGWAAGALLSIMALGGCASDHHAPFVTPPEQHRDIRALESYLQSAADASDNLTLATIGQVSYGDFDAPMWGLAYMRLTGQLSIANYYRLQHSRRVFTLETPTGLAMADRQKIQLMAVRMMISRSGTE